MDINSAIEILKNTSSYSDLDNNEMFWESIDTLIDAIENGDRDNKCRTLHVSYSYKIGGDVYGFGSVDITQETYFPVTPETKQKFIRVIRDGFGRGDDAQIAITAWKRYEAED